MQFTPDEAIQFAEQGQLIRWIELFLTGAGNNPAFWEGLTRAQRWWQPPHKMSLNKLSPAAGLEPHMEYVMDAVGYEERVQAMDLLAFLHIGIELRDTSQSEFVHEINTVRVWHKLLAESLDSHGERGREETNLVILVAHSNNLF